MCSYGHIEEGDAIMVLQRWQVRSSADLGRAVADLRRSHGLTQGQLAERNQLDRSWLSKLESGRTNTVLDQLLRILRRLGATITITADVPAADVPAVVRPVLAADADTDVPAADVPADTDGAGRD